MSLRVVLVRPWTDAHGGGGCCGGEARHGVCFDARVGSADGHDARTALLGEVYLRLRAEVPAADVQIVAASNSAYLLPHVFRAVRRRRGGWAALRELNRATTAGSVLVEGERIGDLVELGVEAVLAEVRRRARLVPHP